MYYRTNVKNYNRILKYLFSVVDSFGFVKGYSDWMVQRLCQDMDCNQ